VNFWQPSGTSNFAAIQPGELFLFRLKSPRNAIGGYGVFSYASRLRISLAWEAFGIKNGAASFEDMRRRVGRLVEPGAAPRLTGHR
jgi:putative restriction endonuclease